MRTSLHCECLKPPLGHGDLTGDWHTVMFSSSALHSIHFLCLIHHYVTLTFRVYKSFSATETSPIFGNKAWQSERKCRFRHDEQDKTGIQKSDRLFFILLSCNKKKPAELNLSFWVAEAWIQMSCFDISIKRNIPVTGLKAETNNTTLLKPSHWKNGHPRSEDYHLYPMVIHSFSLYICCLKLSNQNKSKAIFKCTSR